jgi:uncharacterized protein YecE (DUF72 family)
LRRHEEIAPLAANLAGPCVNRPRIATAGWSIPRAVAGAFPPEGSGLERYAARFDAVEINSTFYRAHRPATYARWVAATPPGFRFSVKLPKRITHEARLIDSRDQVAAFRAEAGQLGDKLGPLLVQLPPSLAFSPLAHEAFFAGLREVWPDPVVLEPRHASWFDAEAEALLRAYPSGRVAADPAPHPGAARPGGWAGVAYWRLHGSPRMYYSAYDEAALAALANHLRTDERRETWCVFDNTASGAAAANALALQELVGSG